MQTHLGHLFSHLEALDLEFAVPNALHQEAEGLAPCLVVNLGFRRDLHEEVEQITEMLVEKSGLIGEELVEDVEGLHAMPNR